ncbi:MAG: ABC transporter substrate-binding protein, partial [Alphaproteobacteria bacterium]|nr:ABC transporter substrate-binding protein [Alphaproteobacteria bacterium]
MTTARISRRDWLQAAAAFATALTVGPRIGRAAGLRAMRFGTGLKAMSPIVINTVIGEALGYNKAEGFQLDPLPLGTNANVQIAVDKGDADFGVGTPSFQLPLLAKRELGGSVNFYEYTYPYKWDVAVKSGSPIKSYAELKGKKIGVSSLGGTEYPVTRNVLKSLGIDPDKDVSWLAVGQGVTAGVALERGAIDALAYYDVGFGQIEAAGIKIMFVPRPKDVPLIGGQFLMCRKDFLATNRALAVGFGRSVAKASTYLLANPAAGAKAFLDMYPTAAPRGATGAEAIKAVLFAVSRRIKLYVPPYPNTQMGYIHESEYRLEAKFDGVAVNSFKGFY